MNSAALDPATIAAALAVFFTTCYLTWKGWRDEKKRVAKKDVANTDAVTGRIHDNLALHHNTEATRENTAAIQRLTDILLLTGKRK